MNEVASNSLLSEVLERSRNSFLDMAIISWRGSGERDLIYL